MTFIDTSRENGRTRRAAIQRRVSDQWTSVPQIEEEIKSARSEIVASAVQQARARNAVEPSLYVVAKSILVGMMNENPVVSEIVMHDAVDMVTASLVNHKIRNENAKNDPVSAPAQPAPSRRRGPAITERRFTIQQDVSAMNHPDLLAFIIPGFGEIRHMNEAQLREGGGRLVGNGTTQLRRGRMAVALADALHRVNQRNTEMTVEQANISQAVVEQIWNNTAIGL